MAFNVKSRRPFTPNQTCNQTPLFVYRICTRIVNYNEIIIEYKITNPVSGHRLVYVWLEMRQISWSMGFYVVATNRIILTSIFFFCDNYPHFSPGVITT